MKTGLFFPVCSNLGETASESFKHIAYFSVQKCNCVMEKIEFLGLRKMVHWVEYSTNKKSMKIFTSSNLSQSGKKKVAFSCQMCYANNACKEPADVFASRGLMPSHSVLSARMGDIKTDSPLFFL